MASASSSAARLFIRDGKSAARLLFHGRAANLRESTVPAIRSLLRFNQTPAFQYPVLSETFPVTDTAFRQCGLVQQENERLGKMEAAHGKKVVDSEASDSEEEDESDIDDDDFDDDFVDEDEDDDDSEEEEKFTKKKK